MKLPLPILSGIEHLKVCSRCKQNKGLDDFYKFKPRYKTKKFELSAHCKACEKERKSKLYIKNRKQQIAKSLKWNKENSKKRNETGAKRRLQNPLYREARKIWEKKNPEKIKQYNLKKDAKRRAAKNSTITTITPEQWKLIKKKQGNKCIYCLKKCTLTQDHIKPLSKGGDHSIKNIIGACRGCNTSKFNHSIEEFAKKRGVLLF